MSAPAPIGLLFLARTERGLRYVEFLERRSIKRVIASHEAEHPGAEWRPSLLDLEDVVRQLEAYFDGERRAFDLPLDPVGTDFQRAVWAELARIPYGETRSYGQIAAAIGQPRATRAVGLANNQNPLPIVVPCHRVVGARGELTGYGGGLPRKRWLLQHEARFAAAVTAPGESVASVEPARRAAQPSLTLVAKPAAGPQLAPPRDAAPARRRAAAKSAPALKAAAASATSNRRARRPAGRARGAAAPPERSRRSTAARGAARGRDRR